MNRIQTPRAEMKSSFDYHYAYIKPAIDFADLPTMSKYAILIKFIDMTEENYSEKCHKNNVISYIIGNGMPSGKAIQRELERIGRQCCQSE